MSSSFGSQLALGDVAHIDWLAKRGMCWGQFFPAVLEYIAVNLLPQVIVVHLGENDLGQRTSMSLRLQARKDFNSLVRQFPGITILWSDMLPRRVWQWASSVKRIEVARKRVNAYLGRVIMELGGAAIHHPSIGFEEPALYRGDGVHLSPMGYGRFLSELQQGLNLFLGAGKAKR